jgi:hypothetical protein
MARATPEGVRVEGIISRRRPPTTATTDARREREARTALEALNIGGTHR